MPKGETDKQKIARMAREMRILQWWLVFFMERYTDQVIRKARRRR